MMNSLPSVINTCFLILHSVSHCLLLSVISELSITMDHSFHPLTVLLIDSRYRISASFLHFKLNIYETMLSAAAAFLPAAKTPQMSHEQNNNYFHLPPPAISW